MEDMIGKLTQATGISFNIKDFRLGGLKFDEGDPYCFSFYNLDKINRIKCLKYYLCSSIGIPAWEFGNSVKTRSCPRSCKVITVILQVFSMIH